jgi:hypothetical protein
VTLSGPSIINLPSGTATYNGVISGQGTLTVAGSGTLVLTKDSDFTLPSADQHQNVTTSGGNWPYPIVTNPDQPAVIVERGATLQYGTDGSTGIIGDYPYTSISGVTLNHDNIEVDGTLDLDIANREYNLGTISGSGLISQPRNTWGTLDVADGLPFTGTIADGTGFNFGSAAFRLALPSAASVHNDGSAIISARNYTLVLPENFYEDQYGSDINFHAWQAGLIEMTGVDHYIDTSLDTASIAHTSNFRGINIEGANVQWGDGTTERFFLPATPSNSYIDIHRNGSLTFDYDGPVTLDTPISGGVCHASLSTPANASISLAATTGNAVTFAVPMNYHGTTTIGRGATLLLGTGTSGGDSSLLTGASNDQVVDNGTRTEREATVRRRGELDLVGKQLAERRHVRGDDVCGFDHGDVGRGDDVRQRHADLDRSREHAERDVAPAAGHARDRNRRLAQYRFPDSGGREHAVALTGDIGADPGRRHGSARWVAGRGVAADGTGERESRAHP